MGWEAVVTLILVLAMLVVMAREFLSPDMASFSVLVVLLLTGILEPAEALSGFANQGMLTVAVLFPVAYAAQSSGILESFAFRIIGKAKPGRRSLLKVMAPVYALSSFLNNTPVVAMVIPTVRDWALQSNISPSKYLIPLSYASIFGGLTTLIGTSTNLVVSGLMLDTLGIQMGLFDITVIGIPAAIVGFSYMMLVGHRLLPDNPDLVRQAQTHGNDYIIEMRVEKNSPILGKSIARAGLRNLKEIYLFSILRQSGELIPVGPNEVIQEDDILVFSGKPEGVTKLNQAKGLVPVHDSDIYKDFLHRGGGRIVEAVIAPGSPLVGKSIKEGNFRGKYDAAILSMQRHGERLQSGLGQIALKAGDTLLILAGEEFEKRWNGTKDFYIVTKRESLPPVNVKKTVATVIAILAMLALAGSGLVPIFYAASGAVVFLVLTRALQGSEVRRSLDLNVLVVIASTLGISKALYTTGAAGALADGLLAMVTVLGPLGVLAAVYLLTSLLTELITNNAAAALMFPVAITAAGQADLNPMSFAMAIAVAASASFATPLGYQTNLMVYGPGGYRFKDFFRIGLPLNLLFFVVALALIPVFFPLQ